LIARTIFKWKTWIWGDTDSTVLSCLAAGVNWALHWRPEQRRIQELVAGEWSLLFPIVPLPCPPPLNRAGCFPCGQAGRQTLLCILRQKVASGCNNLPYTVQYNIFEECISLLLYFGFLLHAGVRMRPFVPELSTGLFCVTRSNPTCQLTDPTQTTAIGKIWTQPNTTNNGTYSLVVAYFYTQNLSRTFSQPSINLFMFFTDH